VALDLSWNDGVTAASGRVLAAMVGRDENERNAVPASQVSILRLRGLALGSRGAAPLLAAIALPPQRVTEVDLAFCGLDDACARALARALGTSASLRRVDISHNRLGPAASGGIADGIGSSAVLERIDVGHNPLGRSACLRLLLAAGQAPAMRWIGMAGCANLADGGGTRGPGPGASGASGASGAAAAPSVQSLVNRLHWVNSGRQQPLRCFLGTAEADLVEYDGSVDTEVLDSKAAGATAGKFGDAVWHESRSVMAARIRDADARDVVDTVDVCTRAFDNDVGSCRMLKLLGSEAAAAKATAALRKAFPILREGFRGWGLSHPGDSPFEVSYSELRSLWMDLGLERAVPVRRRFQASDAVNVAFVSTNFDDSGGDEFNPADALVRFEYIEILTRLAFIVKEPGTEPDDRANAVVAFLQGCMLPPLRRMLSWHACALHSTAAALHCVRLVGPTPWTTQRARRLQSLNERAAARMRTKRAAGLAKLSVLARLGGAAAARNLMAGPAGSAAGALDDGGLRPGGGRGGPAGRWARRTSVDMESLGKPDEAALRAVSLARKASQRRVLSSARRGSGLAAVDPSGGLELLSSDDEADAVEGGDGDSSAGSSRGGSSARPSSRGDLASRGSEPRGSRRDVTSSASPHPAPSPPPSPAGPARSGGSPLTSGQAATPAELQRGAQQLLRQIQAGDVGLPLTAREVETLVCRRVLRPDEVAVPGIYRVAITTSWSASAEASRRGLASMVEEVDSRQEAAVPVTALLQARGHLARLEWLRAVGGWRSNLASDGPPPEATAADMLAETEEAAGELVLRVLKRLEERTLTASDDEGARDAARIGEAETALERAALDAVATAGSSGAVTGEQALAAIVGAMSAPPRSGGSSAQTPRQPTPRGDPPEPLVASQAAALPGGRAAAAAPPARPAPSADAPPAQGQSGEVGSPSPGLEAFGADTVFSIASSLIRLRVRSKEAGAWIQDKYTSRRMPTAVTYGPEKLAFGEVDIVSNAFRRLWFVREDVDRVIARHSAGLQAAYAAYSGRSSTPGSIRRWMSWDEWMELAADSGLVPHFASDRVASAAFVWSGATNESETAGAEDVTGRAASPDHHSFVEFLESLARTAAAGEGMGGYGPLCRATVRKVAFAMRRDDSRRRHRAAVVAVRRRERLERLEREGRSETAVPDADDAMVGSDALGSLPGGRGLGHGEMGRMTVTPEGRRVLLSHRVARWRDRAAKVGRPASAHSRPGTGGPRDDTDLAGATGHYGSGIGDDLLFELEDDAQRRVLVDYLCRVDFVCRAVIARSAGGAAAVAAKT